MARIPAHECYSLAAIRRACAALPAPGERTVVLDLADPRAAVMLIPLVDCGGEVGVVATRRASTLPSHGDDWVFPGGGLDPSDATPAAGAIREASEELGIPRGDFEILGQLDSRGPILSGHRIEVFVAWVTPTAIWQPARGEVDEVCVRTLRHYANPSNAFFASSSRTFDIGTRVSPRIAEIPRDLLHLRIDGEACLWGMQADILAELLGHLDPAGTPHLRAASAPRPIHS
jgi:8-oxo-dGTP pyrophosphatase MutT (NUDIX family)